MLKYQRGKNNTFSTYKTNFLNNLILNTGLIIAYVTNHLTEILRNYYAQLERSVFVTSVYLPVYFNSHEL